MSTKVIEKKLTTLTKEVAKLRSLVFVALKKDPEGEYRSAFVKNVLKAMEESTAGKFTNSKGFLKLLQAK